MVDRQVRQGGGDTWKGPGLPSFHSGCALHRAPTCLRSAPGTGDPAMNEAKSASQGPAVLLQDTGSPAQHGGLQHALVVERK